MKYIFYCKVILFLALASLINEKALFAYNTYRAVCVVPVADLVGQPLQTNNPHKDAEHIYNALPICGGRKNPFVACPRMHQLLFNEIVEITGEKGDEVRIILPNLFYITYSNAQPQAGYWTLKKNLLSLHELEKRNRDIKKIPEPICFTHNNAQQNHQKIITLAFAWYDSLTKQTFSAGTRFVQTNDQVNPHMYAVSVFDPNLVDFRKINIPQRICIIQEQIKNNNDKVKLFVQLLKRWSTINNGFIPYVWGGCSLTSIIAHNSFSERTAHNKNKTISFYEYKDYNQVPKTGFDCSSLVAQAAQICGIPYFYKNTITLAHYLKPLVSGDTLSQGDLIWIRDHIMVVSDIQKNKLIEARHYNHGYGKVHEIPIHEEFKGIDTYKELINIYFNKKPILRLNSKGKIIEKFPCVKLFKLASVWN